MNVETEYIKPADDDVSSDNQEEETQNDETKHEYNKDNTTIFGSNDEDRLAAPKRNNIRRISDELKVTASGALGTGKDGIKKAASGLSSGLKTVTNRIPLPKSPKAFRRRSWHAYDELEDEEHIIPVEKDSLSDDDRREMKKVKDQKAKVKDAKVKDTKSDSKEKSKKDSSKEKIKKDKKDKNKSKKNVKGKIDWCNIDGDNELVDDNQCEKNGDDEQLDFNKTDEPIIFEPLETVDLISTVTISVQEAD